MVCATRVRNAWYSRLRLNTSLRCTAYGGGCWVVRPRGQLAGRVVPRLWRTAAAVLTVRGIRAWALWCGRLAGFRCDRRGLSDWSGVAAARCGQGGCTMGAAEGKLMRVTGAAARSMNGDGLAFEGHGGVLCVLYLHGAGAASRAGASG